MRQSRPTGFPAGNPREKAHLLLGFIPKLKQGFYLLLPVFINFTEVLSAINAIIFQYFIEFCDGQILILFGFRIS